ncbi:hypothetical protein SAMN04487898_12830 [Pedobacter sp. ok626]|uniref:hypothetical protein n=1 Tax=Pedobacter sp. ok626 TaxID=1761882 RepID=UPI00088EABD6|nr:hypothetical protein [Pedobacter sp. ok626]SDL89874.1 hypothetical protein SAMN04487898_12830 [Pedobacter sp. ok626]
MNFDDIKSAWGKDSDNNIKIPNKIEEIKRAELPLDKIKRNMRHEFVVQALSILLIAFVPQVYHFKPVLLLPFNAIYILFVVTCVYFFARFYAFYKRVGASSLTTKDALYQINYDIKLNMELYKMFSYMLFPFVLMILSLLLINLKYDHVVSLLQSDVTHTTFYLYFGLSVVMIFAVLHFSAVYWLKTYYQKYAKEIENILKELKEE